MSESWLSIVGAILLCIPSWTAIACSSFMFYTFARYPDTRSPFTAISIARCFSHFLDCILFGVYYLIRLLWSLSGFSWYSGHLDTVTTACWIFLAPTEVLLGINRMTAINLPLQYNRIFSPTLTTIYIAVSGILSLLFYIYHLQCPFNFNVITFDIEYTSAECFERDTKASLFIVFPCLGVSFLLVIIAFMQILYRSRTHGLMSNRKRWLAFAQPPAQIFVWLIATMIWVSDFRKLNDGRLFKLIILPFTQATAHAMESVIIVCFYVLYQRNREESSG